MKKAQNRRVWPARIRGNIATQRSGAQYEVRPDGWRRLSK